MKTSYHYFTFIIISLLLHYLFFYFTDTKEPVNSETEQMFSSTQSITNKVNKQQRPIAIPDVDSTKLDLQISEAEEYIATIKVTDKDTDTGTVNKTKERSIQSEMSVIQTEKIEAAEIVSTDAPIKNTTELNTKQTVSTQLVQVTQPEQPITTRSENQKVTQRPTEFSNRNYLVTPKTHKATETALLKAELFEQEIVNLPKLTKLTKIRNVKKEIVADSTKVKTQPKKIIAPKLKNNIAPQNTLTNNKALTKKTITTTAKTPKPTFKPKIDTEQLSLNNSIKLPEAVAISGKKPNYPQVAEKLQKKGQVVASMTVLPTGSTREAEIVKSSGYKELDQAVIEFIAQERFMPSLKGQDKVSSKQIFSFSYE